MNRLQWDMIVALEVERLLNLNGDEVAAILAVQEDRVDQAWAQQLNPIDAAIYILSDARKN